jgi:hypothetical protein
MHAGIKLRRLAWLGAAVEDETAHHDSLALVLEDVARAADFIAATEAEEHELVGRVYGVVILGAHGRELPFGGHGRRWVATVRSPCLPIAACDGHGRHLEQRVESWTRRAASGERRAASNQGSKVGAREDVRPGRSPARLRFVGASVPRRAHGLCTAPVAGLVVE